MSYMGLFYEKEREQIRKIAHEEALAVFAEKVELEKVRIEKEAVDTVLDGMKSWEDYEEPDEIWYIDWVGEIRSASINNDWDGEKQIGNYFLSREEAELAVEKLKAWKRVKEAGIRFSGIKTDKFSKKPELVKDLELLFGGEE